MRLPGHQRSSSCFLAVATTALHPCCHASSAMLDSRPLSYKPKQILPPLRGLRLVHVSVCTYGHHEQAGTHRG